MVIPLLAYIIGLIIIGFLHTLLNPVAQAFFEASMNEGAIMTFFQAAWDYVVILYAVIAALALVMYAQKSDRGGSF